MIKNKFSLKPVVTSTIGLLTLSLVSCGVVKQQDTCITNAALCPAIPGASSSLYPYPVVTVIVPTYSATGGAPGVLTVTTNNSYGAVPVGNSMNLTLTVSNTGVSPAVLGTISTVGLGLVAPFSLTGGTCSSLGTVAPSGSCSLVVTYTPSTLGSAAGTVSVPYNNTYSTQTVAGTLSGTGSTPGLLTFSDNPSYNFGNSTVNITSAPKTFTVTNSGGVSATLGTITATGLGLPSVFTVTGGTCQTGATVAAASTCTIILTYTPTSPVNTSVSMSLSYNNGASAQVATRSIQGTGLSVGTLVISDPTTYDFGNSINTLLSGSTVSTHTFHVSNTGQTPVTLGTITTAGLGLSAPFTLSSGGTCVSAGSIAGGSNCTLLIAFAPTTYTLSTGTITVNYLNGTAPTATRAIQGTGAHIAVLTLSTSPSTSPYPFGTVEISGSGSAIVTVTNTGSAPAAPANITDLTSADVFSSTLFTVTGGTCSTSSSLAASDTCTIDVSYAPIAVVTTTGSLTIPYNNGVATVSTSPALSFTGTGIFPGVLSISGGPTYSVGTAYLADQSPAPSPAPTPAPLSTLNTFTVTNTGLAVSLLTVTTNGLGLADPFALTGGTCTTLTSGNLSANSTCTLTISYTPSDDSDGISTQSVALSYFDGVNIQTASLALTGTAEYVANLNFDDSSNFSDGNSYYDFGLVVHPATPTHTFIITNDGETNATLGTISTAGLGLSSTPFSRTGGTCSTSGTLAPGSSCTIIVKFDTSTGTTYTQDMTVHFNDNAGDTSQSRAISLHGQNYIPGVLTFSDGASYNYGTDWSFNSTPHTFTLTNTSAVSITLDATTINGTNLGFNSGPGMNYNGGTCSASMVLAPSDTCTIISYFIPYGAGTYTDSISLSFSDGTHTDLTSGISLTGVGVTPGYFSEYYHYNAVAVGSSAAAYFVFTNVGGYPATISSSLTTAGLNLSAPLTYQAGSCNRTTTYSIGASCTVGVLYTPTNPVVSGAQNLSMNLTSTLSSISPPTQTENASFTIGYGPSVTLTPTAYDYGSHCSTTSNTFTVTNSTTATITLSGVTTDGGLGLDTTYFTRNGSSTCTNSTLAPAATCTIVVNATFPGTSGSTHTNNLTVNYTDWAAESISSTLTMEDTCD